MARVNRKSMAWAVVVLVFGASFLVAFNASVGDTYADTTVTATAAVTVPDTCTIAGNITSGNEHTKTVNPGTYESNIGTTNVSVVCNDRNGFSVYAIGYGNNTDGNTNLTGTGTGVTIPTGTSTNTTVSNWAMKLAPVAGTYTPTILSDTNGSYASYHVVPATATKVVTYTGDINTSSTARFNTTYAVAVSPTQAADTYVGKVKYTVVHPNYTNADGTRETLDVPVNFAGSGVSSVTFSADGYPTRTVSTSGNTANLAIGVQYTMTADFTSGYEFVSWALNNANYGTLGSTSTNPTTFTPNANSASASLTITGQKPKVYIQDLTLANCQVNVGTNGNATNVGDEIDVYDKRDEKAYKVKYINGACWMTQNLRYLGDTGSASKTMTIGNNNSNVANKSITLYSLDSSNAGNFNAYSSHCDSTNGYNYACVYDSGDTTKGVWYNYYAASGGTISTNSNSTAATSDICPKNWHLPTGPNTTANTDINKLVGNTTSGWQNPTTGLAAFSAVAGGFYYYGSLDVTGRGYWWSATASDTTIRYLLYYNSSGGQFYGDYDFYRYLGFFVRCVRSS